MMDGIALQYREKVINSCYDNLTGLYNHGIFNEFLNWEMSKFQRHASPFVLGFIDIDAFDLFNRRNGAIESDLMLKKTARIIAENIRQSDLAARYNGDRFALLLTNATPEGAAMVGENIRNAVEKMSNHLLTISIGLSSVSGSNSFLVDDIISEANAALVEAKLKGKNRVVRFQKKSAFTAPPSGRILIVDDEPLNLKLLEAHLLPLGYEVIKAANGPDALTILSRTEIDLILLDVMMPEMNGFEVCRRVKNSDELRTIPVILVTALDDVGHKIEGIEAGADDFLTKPPNRMELIARTRSLIKVKHLNQNMASIENVLFSLANTVEAKDIYTQGHVKRVSELAVAMGRLFEASEAEIEALRIGGALHDIGKIGVPQEILNKEGPLNAEEWETMKKHPEFGYNICLPLKRNLKQALDIVRQHHEKIDDSGYPDGLKGSEIALPARIMAVADIYDALTTNRPYRKSMGRDRALSILKEEAGQGKLDEKVVACLNDMITAPCL
jgi:putative two-component system response regulator